MHYEDKLGEGSFGKVYSAVRNDDGAKLVVKVPKDKWPSSADHEPNLVVSFNSNMGTYIVCTWAHLDFMC